MTDDLPAFMREDIPPTYPELDRKALVVGSPVLVVDANWSRRLEGPTREPTIPSEVVEKGRVWVTVARIDKGSAARVWRFRMDNQTDGSSSHYAARFRTPEQDAFYQAHNAAYTYLKDQGIIIHSSSSPWYIQEGQIKLARVLWSAEHRAGPPWPTRA